MSRGHFILGEDEGERLMALLEEAAVARVRRGCREGTGICWAHAAPVAEDYIRELSSPDFAATVETEKLLSRLTTLRAEITAKTVRSSAERERENEFLFRMLMDALKGPAKANPSEQ